MRTLLLCITTLIVGFNQSISQSKKSYPKEIEKIDSVVGHFGRACDQYRSSSWTMVLREPNALLLQNSIHNPVSKTRHCNVGTWSIKEDTLIIEMDDKFYREDCMEKIYLLKPFLNGHILVPLNSDVNLNKITSDLELEYESQLKDYKEYEDYDYIKNKILMDVFRRRFYQFTVGQIN